MPGLMRHGGFSPKAFRWVIQVRQTFINNPDMTWGDAIAAIARMPGAPTTSGLRGAWNALPQSHMLKRFPGETPRQRGYRLGATRRSNFAYGDLPQKLYSALASVIDANPNILSLSEAVEELIASNPDFGGYNTSSLGITVSSDLSKTQLESLKLTLSSRSSPRVQAVERMVAIGKAGMAQSPSEAGLILGYLNQTNPNKYRIYWAENSIDDDYTDTGFIKGKSSPTLAATKKLLSKPEAIVHTALLQRARLAEARVEDVTAALGYGPEFEPFIAEWLEKITRQSAEAPVFLLNYPPVNYTRAADDYPEL